MEKRFVSYENVKLKFIISNGFQNVIFKIIFILFHFIFIQRIHISYLNLIIVIMNDNNLNRVNTHLKLQSPTHIHEWQCAYWLDYQTRVLDHPIYKYKIFSAFSFSGILCDCSSFSLRTKAFSFSPFCAAAANHGTLQRLELSPQELRPRFSRLVNRFFSLSKSPFRWNGILIWIFAFLILFDLLRLWWGFGKRRVFCG